MLFLELVLVLRAQIHHRLHVDFIESREDRGSGLGLQQTLGHTGAQARHRHALLRPAGQQLVDIDRRRHASERRPRRRRRCCRRCRRRPGRGTAPDVGNDIGLGNTAVAAAAGDGLGIELVVLHHLARRGHQLALVRDLLCRLRYRSRGPFGRLGHGRGRIGRSIDHGDDFARDHRAAIALDDLGNDAARRRGKFQHHLVGFDVDQVFVAGNGLAHFLVPAQQRRLGHRFGQLRYFHFD